MVTGPAQLSDGPGKIKRRGPYICTGALAHMNAFLGPCPLSVLRSLIQHGMLIIMLNLHYFDAKTRDCYLLYCD